MATITGNGKNNTLIGTAAEADTISGLGGDDSIDALTVPGAEKDTVDGGVGIDTLVVNASSETKAVQLTYGGSPTYSVFSDSGDFRVDAYNMELIDFTGGSGNDSINSGERGGAVNGSGGIDHWLANLGALFADVTFELGTTAAIGAAGLTSILGMERISLTTGSGNDKITGGGHADSINSGDGDDTINAGARSDLVGGFDVVDGGEDFDTLVVNAAAETQAVQLTFGGSPVFSVFSDSGNFRTDAYDFEAIKFTGGSGNDSINTGNASGTVNGKGGNDHWLANLSAIGSGIVFDVAATASIAAAGLTSIQNLERISLTTGAGNDTITGGKFEDTINTGNGDDIIDAKTRPTAGGFDVVDGGRGTDTLIVDAAAENKAVQLTSGGSPAFSLFSNSGKFRVDAYNIERVRFTGGEGNDSINTGGGAEEVRGGLGTDTWIAHYGGAKSDVVFDVSSTAALLDLGVSVIADLERINMTTGSGNDTITGGSQDDVINTSGGDDAINAKSRPTGGGFDVVDGGTGIDTLIINAATDSQGVQLTSGGSPTFSLFSNSNKFRVDAYNIERVMVTGGSGNDSLNTGAGGVTVDGKGGIDHWLADLGGVGADIAFKLGTTNAIAAAGLTTINRIERISLTTGSGNDDISGGAEADTINTGSGNDTLNAMTRPIAGGFDVLDGGIGLDTLEIDASAEIDTVQLSAGGSPSFSLFSNSGNFRADAYNIERVMVTGGSGNDSLNTGAGGVTVDGKGGMDHWLADLGGVDADIVFKLGTTGAIAAAGLTAINRIERISLTTGGGSDDISGGAEADTINTGRGNDILNAMTRPIAGGFDVLDGGTGFDTLEIDASAEIDTVQLSAGGSPSFSLFSNSGNFRADAYGMERAEFKGGSGNDIANGGGLNDRLTMGLGNDQASGGNGSDTIRGEAGADSIRGGRGADKLTGGADADTFFYGAVRDSRVSTSEADTITDFVSGLDKINLEAIDADGFGNTGDQAFAFIGAAAFSGLRGELRSAGGALEADIDGDKSADFRINGAGAAVLADIVL